MSTATLPAGPAVTPAADFAHDVFVSSCDEDLDVVEQVFFADFRNAGLRFMDYRDLPAGGDLAVEYERAVSESRYTLLVLTEAWVQSPWAGFAGGIAQALDPTGRTRRLIPVKLKACEVPHRFAALVLRDLTDLGRRAEGMGRLLRDLGVTVRQVQESLSQSARNGIIALGELMDTPAVRDAVRGHREALDRAGTQIRILRHCKQLHDCLHTVEELYEVVWSELGPGEGDGLEPDAEALADAIDLAVKSARTNLADEDIGWTADLARAGQGALDGARRPDPRRLRAALVQINRLLTTYLDRVNGWIVQRVRAMELGRAVDALRAIDVVLTGAPLAPAAAPALGAFRDGTRDLGRLDEALRAFTRTHACLQRMDGAIKACPEPAAWEDVCQVAPTLTDALQDLTVLSGDPWAEELRKLCTDLRALVDAGDPATEAAALRLFRTCRRKVDNGFKRTDIDLLAFCDTLQGLRPPIEALKD